MEAYGRKAGQWGTRLPAHVCLRIGSGTFTDKKLR